ncbi:MAG: pyruvate ferredoxin oxidoreductase subunit gamma [Patescibacteria group bacterium]
MIEVRLHGRGGQGVVTAAELIAIAAFHQNKYAQAFPFFGVERQGAPVEAYCRISDQPISLRSQIYQPDFLIIQDPSLISDPRTLNGIKQQAIVIINSEKELNNLNLSKNIKVFTIPATSLALEILGKPIINTALLGAFAAATNLISLKALEQAISEKFNEKNKELAAKNIRLAQKAYNYVINTTINK